MSARDVGRLQSSNADTCCVGFTVRHGVIRAYNIATSRRMQDQHIAEQVRLGHLTGGHVFEMPVCRLHWLAGRQSRISSGPAESSWRQSLAMAAFSSHTAAL